MTTIHSINSDEKNHTSICFSSRGGSLFRCFFSYGRLCVIQSTGKTILTSYASYSKTTAKHVSRYLRITNKEAKKLPVLRIDSNTEYDIEKLFEEATKPTEPTPSNATN